jgi:hypothetical protein
MALLLLDQNGDFGINFLGEFGIHVRAKHRTGQRIGINQAELIGRQGEVLTLIIEFIYGQCKKKNSAIPAAQE